MASASVSYDKKILDMIGISVQSRVIDGKQKLVYQYSTGEKKTVKKLKPETSYVKKLKPKTSDVKKVKPEISDDKDIRCFLPDAEFFDLKRKPKKGDWLAEHKERGQTFQQFQHCIRLHVNPRQNTIYLIPMTFFEDNLPDDILQHLVNFSSIFFGMKVKIKKQPNLKEKVSHRLNDDVYQVHAGEVLKVMETFIPSDAFCAAGITLCDLYPRESWNFVFGLANLGGKSGIYSLARYLSNFGENETSIYIPELEKEGMITVILRACKTMCHEISHMFGLKHCIAFQCIMNGSNHLQESDSRPMFLCPVCLRKLHDSIKFDVVSRYQEMENFFRELNRPIEADWLKRRREHITS